MIVLAVIAAILLALSIGWLIGESEGKKAGRIEGAQHVMEAISEQQRALREAAADLQHIAERGAKALRGGREQSPWN